MLFLANCLINKKNKKIIYIEQLDIDKILPRPV